jgi:NAD(P)-dependent dehydrogenase (short-subunit alcohol dehydrogenase family)
MPDRIAVVTGATGTLGRELVRGLAEQGLVVVAVSRSGDAPGLGETHAHAADMSQDASIDAIRSVLPAGELAMAVHAVGLPGSSGVASVEPSLLATAVDIKAGGFLRLLRAVDARITEGSRLVAVGGHLGIEPTEHAPLAGVANAALANLVRQLVGPIGRRGATVHLVAPGPFESDRVEALIAAKAQGQGISIEAARAQLIDELPQGRLPTAGDVASIIAMLGSPSASALHGSTLFLDGGSRRGIF